MNVAMLPNRHLAHTIVRLPPPPPCALRNPRRTDAAHPRQTHS